MTSDHVVLCVASFQVLCDGKNFDVAIQDFNAALSLTPDADQVGRARLLAGEGGGVFSVFSLFLLQHMLSGKPSLLLA